LKYPIVKPYLPSIDKYQQFVADIFSRNYLTNNGPLLQQLEQRLAGYLGVEHLLLVTNGTVALQVAYAALDIEGKVLTTPFSFAATASSLCWQKLTPVFIDIDQTTLNIDITKIDEASAKKASAILPVHVFGNPCDVIAIEQFAKENQLKVIYDAAHAFTTELNGQSILQHGDAATLSLHATKLFHCVEGGAIIFKHETDYLKAKQMINFGFNSLNQPEFIGINAKMSELHAAMGLAVFDDIDFITSQRKTLVNQYKTNLEDIKTVTFQHWHQQSECTGAYMPILLESEQQLLSLAEKLLANNIQTRRYFYPSLSSVDIYAGIGNTPISENIASRILCLPLYTDLLIEDVDYICQHVKTALL